jgi:hypothetical protein
MNNSRFSKDNEKPFHSHTFAEAASGGSMGATSAQSFGQRHQIDQNRKVVKRYSDSFVALPGEHLKEELIKRIESPDARPGHNKHKFKMNRQAFNAGEAPSTPRTGSTPLQVPKRGFSEPTGRKFNPFS